MTNTQAWITLVAGFALLAVQQVYSQEAIVPKPVATIPYRPPAVPAINPQPPAKPRWTVPPAQYDRTFNGPLLITVVSTSDELKQRCFNFNTPGMLGCAQLYAGKCEIFLLPDELIRERGWTTGLMIRHEIGHCNGWPGDHPGLRDHVER